jgi:outer membrane murein-binding lipoprotein Lpp
MTDENEKTMPILRQEIASFGKNAEYLEKGAERLDKQVTALDKDVKAVEKDVTELKISVRSWGIAAKIVGIPSAIGILVLAGFFWNAQKKVNELEARVQTLDTQVTELSKYSNDIEQKRDAALTIVDAEAAKSAKSAVAAEMKDINDKQSISRKVFLAPGPGKCPLWAPRLSTVYVMVSPPPPGWPSDAQGPIYASAHFSSTDLCGTP